MTKKVAFDIDDTICSSMPKFVKELNTLTGKIINYDEIDEMLKDHPIDINPLEVMYGDIRTTFHEHEESWILDMEVIQEGLAKAKEHAELGHDMYYITARPSAVNQKTIQWLMVHGFPYGEVIHESDKVKMAKKLGIDIFYEDNPNNAKLLSEAGVETYLIDCVHNRHHELGIERLIWK